MSRCKYSILSLKTLFNIEEAPFFFLFLTLMSVLYDDDQMDQKTARNTNNLKFIAVTIEKIYD